MSTGFVLGPVIYGLVTGARRAYGWRAPWRLALACRKSARVAVSDTLLGYGVGPGQATEQSGALSGEPRIVWSGMMPAQ